MKQEKNSVVKSIKHNFRQYSGKSGDTMCVHFISFQNGDEGELHSTSLICSEFTEGEAAYYSIEQKGYRSGKPEMRIRPIISRQNSSNHGGGGEAVSSSNTRPGKPQRNETAIMAQHAISQAIQIFAAGGIKREEIKAVADEILHYTATKGNMSLNDIISTPVDKHFIGKIDKKITTKSELF